MRNRTNQVPYKSFAVSMLISASIVIACIYIFQSMSHADVFAKLILPLSRLILAISAGLIAGEILEALGWTRRIAVVAGPLFSFGHLGERCSAAFITAFVSGVASNAMLQDFYKDGKITKKQLYLGNLVNQLPAFFVHLPSTFFLVVSLTRWAGVLYFFLTFVAAILRTTCFLVYGRFQLPVEDFSYDKNIACVQTTKNKISIVQDILKKFPQRLMGMAVYVIPVYVLVLVLQSLNVFDMTRDWLARFVTTTFIPIEALSVVVLSFAAEFASGFAAAGALMDAGVLTTKQTVLALIIGNIIAFPIRAIRHQLPRYVGVFSPRTGAELLFMGQAFRVASLILVGFMYYVLV